MQTRLSLHTPTSQKTTTGWRSDVRVFPTASLCKLCVLCVSVVVFPKKYIDHRDTEHTKGA